MTHIEFNLPVLQDIKEKLEAIDSKLESIKMQRPPCGVWLTTREAAIALKISIRTIQNYRDQGIIPFAQFGREIRYRAEDIQQFLIQHYVDPQALERSAGS